MKAHSARPCTDCWDRDSFRPVLALKNLMRRKARSVFAILQIAVAIAAFVSIVGVTQGLRAQFYRIGQVFAFDVIVQRDGAPSPIFSAIRPDEVSKILDTPGVRAVSPMGMQFLVRPDPTKPQPVGFVALEPSSELIARYTIVRGRKLQDSDTNAVIIGQLMADTLGVDTTNLVAGGLEGEPPELKLVGSSFRVVGIFESPLEEVPFLSGLGIMKLDHYLSTFQQPINMVVVHHSDPGRRAESIDDVKLGLGQGRTVAPQIDKQVPGLKARTIEDFLESFKQVELVDSFALAISLLAALVSVIGVTNTMLMSVFDRTREIGLLRAIGWSRFRIVTMIEAEGFLLSLAGGLLGIPFGLILIEASRLLIEMGWLNVTLDLGLYGAAVGVAVWIGLVGSVYPALRAAYLPPTEALRYE
jgi:putative ABC transport system permease protein